MTTAALPNVTVQQLAYLEAVATAPTWAAAAADLGVSPSALSQGLAELERRLGIELFERDGRRRALRPTTGPVLDHARRVLAATRDLVTWSREVATGRAGRLRVGMIDAAAVHFFGAPLRRFRESRPGLDLHLQVTSSAPLLAALGRGEVDVAVCVAPVHTAENHPVTDLLAEPLEVYAPATVDPAVVADPARWGPWVGFPAGAHTRAVIERGLARLGASYRVVAESHQPEVLREMVGLGVGWTVLGVSAGAGDHPGTLRVGGPVGERRIVAVNRRSATAADDLVAALVASVGQARGSSGELTVRRNRTTDQAPTTHSS